MYSFQISCIWNFKIIYIYFTYINIEILCGKNVGLFEGPYIYFKDSLKPQNFVYMYVYLFEDILSIFPIYFKIRWLERCE
jgi:hypothetical protein